VNKNIACLLYSIVIMICAATTTFFILDFLVNIPNLNLILLSAGQAITIFSFAISLAYLAKFVKKVCKGEKHSIFKVVNRHPDGTIYKEET